MPNDRFDRLRVDIWFGYFRAVLRQSLFVCLGGWSGRIDDNDV